LTFGGVFQSERAITARKKSRRREVKLSKRESEGVVIVDVKGKFIGSPENSDMFHSFFKSLLAEGWKKVVVNLGESPWANSQGIGMLIGAHTSFANAGGELVLARVTDRVNDILTVTRLLLIFKTFETEDAALAHLSASD
jgi:anti-sigma B factor antagonist